MRWDMIGRDEENIVIFRDGLILAEKQYCEATGILRWFFHMLINTRGFDQLYSWLDFDLIKLWGYKRKSHTFCLDPRQTWLEGDSDIERILKKNGEIIRLNKGDYGDVSWGMYHGKYDHCLH